MNPEPLQVVLDCDTANEVDDQFAIAYALGSPLLDIRGIVSVHNTLVHGAASRDRYQEEAERIVRLCGCDYVPCLRGAVEPMQNRDVPVASEGLDFLVEEARSGMLTLLATGPATDMASLLLAAPEVRENLRVVWLGGFGDRDSYERFKFQELNGRADIAAWRVLLETQVKLTQVPGWPGAAKLCVQSAPFAEELRAMGRPITSYLAEILTSWVEHYEGPIDPSGQKILWDIANVAAILDPPALTVEERPAPWLDAAGAHDFTRPGRMINVVTDIDAPRVLSGLREALLHHPGASLA